MFKFPLLYACCLCSWSQQTIIHNLIYFTNLQEANISHKANRLRTAIIATGSRGRSSSSCRCSVLANGWLSDRSP
jgi:hypothetical protein